MRLSSTILMLMPLVFLGALWSSARCDDATPKERIAGTQEVVQGQKGITDVVPSNKDQMVVLSPFYQLRRKDSKVWLERIIVTFLMEMPKDCLKYDFNSPTFRKGLYDLLQSENPKTAIQSQVLASLSRELGVNVEATMQISRSVIIVR